MIYKTEDDAIAAAVDHVRHGRLVAYCFGRDPADKTRPTLELCAFRIPGADASTGFVVVGGRNVIVPRIPFTPGSHIFGWKGAVVISPRVKRALSERQFESLIEAARRCHRVAGIEA